MSKRPPMAFCYVRFSHVDSKYGKSEEAQLEAMRRYHEFRLPGVPLFPDFERCTDRVVSAFKKPFSKRPAGQFVLSQLQPGDHLLVLRMDRMFRKALDALTMLDQWTKQGITVHFTDQMIDLSTANGRVFVQMLAVFAEWESAVKGERIRESIALRRKSDLLLCNPAKCHEWWVVTPTKNRATGDWDRQLVFDASWLPTLEKYHKLLHSPMSRDAMRQQVTRENYERAGEKYPGWAFTDESPHRVAFETILTGGLTWEFAKDKVVRGEWVSFNDCMAYIQARTPEIKAERNAALALRTKKRRRL